jgi:PAS domain S-box-containing protein
VPASLTHSKPWPPRRVARVALLIGIFLVTISALALILVDLELDIGDWHVSPGRHAAAAVIFLCAVAALSALLIMQTLRWDRLNTVLSAGEADYRELVEANPEAILVHRNGKVVLVNQSCVVLLGATDRAQLIGRSVLDLMHPDDREPAQTQIGEMQNAGEVAGIAQRRARRLDGTFVHVEATAAPLRDRGGRSIQVVLRDITDRNRVEAELVARTRQQEAVAALGQYALEAADLDALFAEASRRIGETLGTEIVVIFELMPDGSGLVLRACTGGRDERIGKMMVPASHGSLSGFTLLSGEVVLVDNLATETRFEKIPALLDMGAVSGLSIVIRGKERPFGVLGAHSKSRRTFSRDDCNFIAAVAYILAAAITRAQVGRRLRDQQARLEGILANTTDGIITIDESGIIESANPAAAQMFGRAEDELVGRNVQSLLGGSPRDETGAFLRGFLVPDGADPAAASHQIDGRRRDGKVFPLEYGIGALSLHGRRFFICTLRDMSERRATEEQLRQLQKMEAVGQLSGGIAHDFNNLLTVILGNAELLMDERDAPASRRSTLEIIRAAAERGAGLTQQLLAYSRRQSLRATSFDLNNLVGGMDELLSRSLGETIEIRTDLAADLWPVMADPSQVESALLNLAVNARDAMPEGGALTIETANVALDDVRNRSVRAGDYVMLAITDNGTGMEPDVAARAFEPFFTTKEVGKGTGLGLSMVYGFARQSGGDAVIESEPGRGTTVRLYLPRALAMADEAAPSGAAIARSAGGETILVVEDDDMVRHTVVIQLGSLGYRVIEAANGPQALAKIAEAHGPVDLLFTDMVMPRGMNGRQLAEAARHLIPSLRVLYTSGYDRNAIDADGQADGSLDMLGKPYQMGELARMVRKILDDSPKAVT